MWFLFTYNIYKVNDSLTDLIYKCIWIIENCEDSTVHIDEYYINIKTSSSTIELWNENKWYAWLTKGSVNGRGFDDIAPSKLSKYLFKECLKKHGYNIFPTAEKLQIDISDIKC